MGNIPHKSGPPFAALREVRVMVAGDTRKQERKGARGIRPGQHHMNQRDPIPGTGGHAFSESRDGKGTVGTWSPPGSRRGLIKISSESELPNHVGGQIAQESERVVAFL